MTAGSRAPEAALADYVLGLRLEDVPAEVRAYARMILLDCIGIAAGASGAEALAALIAGIETQLAILRALGRRHREDGRGFRTTTISAPLSAALACARVLGLDREAALNALGLAAVLHPAGLLVSLAPENDAFGMDKDFANGQAAAVAVAVKASLLAARGVAASGQAVSGVSGLIESYAFGDGRPLVPPVPGRFETCRVALKRYPACYGCHAAIEAALALRAEDGLADPAAFQSVRVRVKKAAAETLNVYAIRNHMAARFSLPYCVAAAFVRGRVEEEDFSDRALADPGVLALSQRIEVIEDPRFTRLYHESGSYGGAVDVTHAGRTVSRGFDDAPGGPTNPLPDDVVVAKFHALSAPIWDEARRQAIADAVAGIEALQDVRALGDLFLDGS